MSDSKFINISERAYKYIRQFTIKSVEDALIELITNCIDAYNKTNTIEREIVIEVYVKNWIVKIRDKAIGLTAEKLESCFLQVGDYTSSDTSRGFFSRGAKDISALGNLTFKTIKNGKFSQCSLSTDAYGMMDYSDIDATSDIRKEIGLPEPYNGLEVSIELLPNFQHIDINSLYNNLCKLGVLRDINANTTNNFIYLRQIDSNGNQNFNRRVSYTYPKGELLLDVEYIIPNYPKDKARFVIYKSEKPIDQPIKDSNMEFGFLIRDSSSVYEVNTINDRFRWNPQINYLYGFITCESIKSYLLDYDVNGASTSNPYPIIDPSRLTGLNKQHPFIIDLFSIPLTRIDLILRELGKTISSKSVSIEDMDDLLDELSSHGLNIINNEDITVNFLPSYDGNLIKAINDDRVNFVTSEKSYILSGDFSTEEKQLENYIKEEILKIQSTDSSQNYFFMDENNKLVQIQNKNNNINDPIDIIDLIPQENIEQIKKKPMVYKLSSSGELIKLYVFQKGSIDLDNLVNDKMKIKNKQFNIEFINDINILQRYIIDNTDGIVVKLNLHNPIVAKYLTNKNLSEINNFYSLAEISSTKSLVFMKQLVTDVFADIILDSEMQNNKIEVETSLYNNSKKIMQARNNIITRIELSIDNMFEKYIIGNTKKKLDNANITIQFISDSIAEKVSYYQTEDTQGDLIKLRTGLQNLLLSMME